MGLLITLDSSHSRDHDCRCKFCCIKWPLFYCKQPVLSLAVVRVLPLLTETVVLFHRRKRRIRRKPRFHNQLLQRLRFQKNAILHRFPDILRCDVVVDKAKLIINHPALQLLIFHDEAHRAVVRILLRYIASPVPVHDLPRRLIRQVLNLASQLLSRRVLIDEPLSTGI